MRHNLILIQPLKDPLAEKIVLNVISTSDNHRMTEQGVAPEAVAEAFHAFEQGGSKVAPLSAAAVSNQSIQESMRLLLLVRAYQVVLPPLLPEKVHHTVPAG